MTQVEPEEAQAIQEAFNAPSAGPKGLVEPRNFSQPRRLSAQRLQHLSKLISSNLQGICNELAAPLRSFYKMQLASISEINATDLFESFEPPFVVFCGEIRGDLAWLIWEPAAATTAVETVLSGEPDEGVEVEPRVLSRSEARVLGSLFECILRNVCTTLGLDAPTGHLAQHIDELVTLRDAGPDADSRRLALHLAFEGPGGPSDLRLYLPGVGAADSAHAGARSGSLPEHLDDVKLDVCAYLGAIDLPLRELIALEVGDILPLGIEVGSSLDLYVDERAAARASWGQVGGVLAVRIDRLDLRAGEIQEPDSDLTRD